MCLTRRQLTRTMDAVNGKFLSRTSTQPTRASSACRQTWTLCIIPTKITPCTSSRGKTCGKTCCSHPETRLPRTKSCTLASGTRNGTIFATGFLKRLGLEWCRYFYSEECVQDKLIVTLIDSHKASYYGHALVPKLLWNFIQYWIASSLLFQHIRHLSSSSV